VYDEIAPVYWGHNQSNGTMDAGQITDAFPSDERSIISSAIEDVWTS
jgi:hypothetical protein